MQRKCPKCGKLKLRRLFGTGAAVVFKGSGFYQTDYRSDSYKKAAEKDKTSDDGGDKPSSDAAKKDGEAKEIRRTPRHGEEDEAKDVQGRLTQSAMATLEMAMIGASSMPTRAVGMAHSRRSPPHALPHLRTRVRPGERRRPPSRFAASGAGSSTWAGGWARATSLSADAGKPSAEELPDEPGGICATPERQKSC